MNEVTVSAGLEPTTLFRWSSTPECFFLSGVQQELLQGLEEDDDGEGEGEDPGPQQVRLLRDQHILQKGTCTQIILVA